MKNKVIKDDRIKHSQAIFCFVNNGGKDIVLVLSQRTIRSSQNGTALKPGHLNLVKFCPGNPQVWPASQIIWIWPGMDHVQNDLISYKKFHIFFNCMWSLIAMFSRAYTIYVLLRVIFLVERFQDFCNFIFEDCLIQK